MEMRCVLPVSVLKEEGRYVAYTPALDLSTSGESEMQVKQRFGEAVRLFFEELVKMGTLDEVLSELGWKKLERNWQPPEIVSQGSEPVSVAVCA